MTPIWNDYMEDRKQLELDFRSPEQKVARELGIRWEPEEASPEVIKEWQETDGKWWAEKNLTFVAIASLVQLCALAFMGLSMFVIGINLGK
tara:strand:+ start:1877 stop:2149 length:273 start_codon:yes stop_codon:yes gene_type:complete